VGDAAVEVAAARVSEHGAHLDGGRRGAAAACPHGAALVVLQGQQVPRRLVQRRAARVL